MRVAGERVEDVSEQEVGEVPAELDLRGLGPYGGARREVTDQGAEATEREPASPEIAEVDLVVALEVRLQGFRTLGEQADEPR